LIYRTLLATLLFAAAGCSGGGGSGAPAPLPPVPATQAATGHLSISRSIVSAATSRRPKYVSPSTTYATLFIDGAATGYRQACSPAAPCTIDWSSSAGSHTFFVEIDDSASISGGGVVLAEGSETVTLNPGTNLISPLALNGVPAFIVFVSETTETASAPTCQVLLASVNCTIVQFGVADADDDYIISPGLIDDGGVQISSTWGAYATPVVANPDASGNDYTGAIACIDGQTGAGYTIGYSLSANDGAGTPGEIAPLQLASYSLTYPDQQALEMQGWPTYACSNGSIAASGAANGSVTVQSTRRR
jgi:hypothetical protein